MTGRERMCFVAGFGVAMCVTAAALGLGRSLARPAPEGVAPTTVEVGDRAWTCKWIDSETWRFVLFNPDEPPVRMQTTRQTCVAVDGARP